MARNEPVAVEDVAVVADANRTVVTHHTTDSKLLGVDTVSH